MSQPTPDTTISVGVEQAKRLIESTIYFASSGYLSVNGYRRLTNMVHALQQSLVRAEQARDEARQEVARLKGLVGE